MALKFVAHFAWIAIALEPARRRRAAVGRGGRLLLRRACGCPTAARIPLQGALARRPAAAVRGHRVRAPTCSSAHPGAGRARRSSSSTHFADVVPALAHLPGPSADGRPAARRSSTRRGCGGSSRSCSTRTEFLGPHGIRAISRRHADAAVRVRLGRRAATSVDYLPAESDTGMFGGNSNWRGPVWFPMNLVILRALLQLHALLRRRAHGRVPDRLRARAEPRARSPRRSAAASTRPSSEARTAAGPCSAGIETFQTDPHWRDLLLFHEYFHGDNGAGHRREPPDRLDRDRRAADARSAAAGRRRRVGGRRRSVSAMRLPGAPDDLRDQHRGLARAARPRRSAARRSATCPRAEWDALAALPVDAVWLMGVWERSPAGLAIALRRSRASTPASARRCPTCATEDVIGSPYCVRDYVVDARFGGPDGARRGARRSSPRAGSALILDYVPNHVAPDHPGPATRPGVLRHGHRGRPRRRPGGVPAHRRPASSRSGRDPYFPPWPDVVQLNAFAPALRDGGGRHARRHRRRSATGCAATWRC